MYDRTGKAIRKINRKGQSGEEYISLYTVTLDEENKEMFVNDILGKKIVVYDLYGNFKRSFKHKNGTDSQFYSDIFNYDRQHLICYDEYDKELPFVLISKQDGSITQEIKIPFKEKKFLSQIRKTGENNGRAVIGVGPGHYYSIFPFNDNWLLSRTFVRYGIHLYAGLQFASLYCKNAVNSIHESGGMFDSPAIFGSLLFYGINQKCI